MAYIQSQKYPWNSNLPRRKHLPPSLVDYTSCQSHYWPPLLDSGFQFSLPFLISCFLNGWLPWSSRWQRRVCRTSPLPSHYSPSFSTLSKQDFLSQALKYNVFQHWEQHFKMATLFQRATRSQALPHSMFFSVKHLCLWCVCGIYLHTFKEFTACPPQPIFTH